MLPFIQDMYSITLKCFLTFVYTISFCYADPDRIEGHFDQIVLVQRSPIMSFCLQHNKWPHESTIFNELIMNPKQWIIHGFWPIHFNDIWPTYCKTIFNEWSQYDHDDLADILKQELRRYWPVLIPGQKEEERWGSEYYQYGSCITSSADWYFENAVEMVKKNNIGSILEIPDIVPGKGYDINSIMNNITAHIQTDIKVICLQSENTQRQYLLEVHLCYHGGFQLIDCFFIGSNCDPNKEVFYAEK